MLSNLVCAKRNVALFAGVVLFLGMAAPPIAMGNITNYVPYRESFESYTNGTLLDGQAGWYCSEFDAATVATTNYWSHYRGGCYPMPDATHTNALKINNTSTNMIQGNIEVTWVDFVLSPVYWTETNHPPVGATAPHLAMYVNSNGHLVVYNYDYTNFVTRWTEFTQTHVSSSDWVRVSLHLDYVTERPVATPQSIWCFQVKLNGATLSHPDGIDGGTWFPFADPSAAQISQIQISGTGYLDDLVVTNDRPNTFCYSIEATGTGRGVLAPSGTVFVAEGGSTNFAATPDPYRYIAQVATNGTMIAGPFGAVYTSYWNNVTEGGNTLAVRFRPFMATNDVPFFWLARHNPAWATDKAAADAAAMADSDGDSFLNWEEYYAQTDPLVRGSLFEIVRQQNNAGFNVLFWPAATNATPDFAAFWVVRNTNITDQAAWTPADGTFAIAGVGTNQWTEGTVWTGNVQPFYRILATNLWVE